MAKHSTSTAPTRDLIVEPAWTPARLVHGLGSREVGFLALVSMAAAWSWYPLTTVILRSVIEREYEHYSHIVLIPFITAYLVLLNQAAIQRAARSAPLLGAALLGLGGGIVWLAHLLTLEYRLSVAMVGLVITWIAAFVMFYGGGALRRVAFPMALLLFMIPWPPPLLHSAIVFLQRASAEASAVLFGMMDMPVFRQGMVFALPGLTIEVAEECSGIRSSLALLISGLVMAYVFLRTPAARTALAVMIIPVAIAKNAVRIVVLSWLAVHVDPSFITGSAVHRTSGMPVFLGSLSILGAILWLLRRWEQRTHTTSLTETA